MKLTVAELIKQKNELASRKRQRYEIETTLGTITAELPDAATVAEVLNLRDNFEGYKRVVYNCVVEPDLKNDELQKAFETFEPIDIVEKIFLPGEISKIANKLFDLAGYEGSLTIKKLYEEVKN